MEPTARLLEKVNTEENIFITYAGSPVLATPAAFGAGVVWGAKVCAGAIGVAGGGAALCTATITGCGK